MNGTTKRCHVAEVFSVAVCVFALAPSARLTVRTVDELERAQNDTAIC